MSILGRGDDEVEKIQDAYLISYDLSLQNENRKTNFHFSFIL